MGFQDRDYYREESSWSGAAGAQRAVSSWVTRLIIVNVALYFADALFADDTHWLMKGLALHPNTWSQPLKWWQFISCGFAHSPESVGHLVGNMLGLWMFGRQVEQVLGGWEFLRFYLVALIVGTGIWSLRMAFSGSAHADLPMLMGASGAVTAVIMLFVFHFPHQRVLLMMLFPIPAWVLGALLVLGDLSGATGATQGEGKAIAFDVHLAGAALAFAYFRFRFNFGRLWTWRRGAVPWPLRRAPRLRVHRGGGEYERDMESQYQALDEEADRILAKLHIQGDGSLSEQERRILEDYSRRMRQKHR